MQSSPKTLFDSLITKTNGREWDINIVRMFSGTFSDILKTINDTK